MGKEKNEPPCRVREGWLRGLGGGQGADDHRERSIDWLLPIGKQEKARLDGVAAKSTRLLPVSRLMPAPEAGRAIPKEIKLRHNRTATNTGKAVETGSDPPGGHFSAGKWEKKIAN
ncbi:hypothetical protein ACUUL3_16425 [Thiovibrio sp. JS02]